MRFPLWLRNRETLGGLALFAVLALVIGCGGGGGGGGGSSTATATGSGSGSGTATSTSSSSTTGTTSTTATTGTTASTTSGTTSSTTSGTTSSTTSGTTSSTTSGTTGTSGGSTGTLFPDQIFYSHFAGVGKEIRRVKPDGTGDTLFATLPAEIPNATVSDDGSVYAFFVERDADPGAGVDIRYNLYQNTSVNATGATRLTPQNGSNDFWDFIYVGTVVINQAKTKIFFTGSRSEGEFGVYSVNVGGGGLTRLGDGEEAYVNLAGNKLVLTRVVGGAGDIGTMNVDGTGFTNLTNNASEDFMPQWSKDGTQIVWSTDRNATFDVYRMNANGTSQTKLVGTTEDEYGPSLNDAGTQVAYTVISGDPNAYGVYKANVNGTGIGSVVLDSAVEQVVFWTPGSGPQGRLQAAGYGVQLGRAMRPRIRR